MSAVPAGTVTFLFTDIEGSTRRWAEDEEGMGRALELHDAVLVDAIGRHHGTIFKHTGDGICAVFPAAGDAVAAALAAQRGLAAAAWRGDPIRSRMGVHSGDAVVRGGDYFGPTLNEAARLMDGGHGGQVLVSQATEVLLAGSLPPGGSLLDLGEHRFRDLSTPRRVHQLLHPDLPGDFPPLRSLEAYPNNLPTSLSRFVGRSADVDEIAASLAASRLVTLTGVGGVGKTRLALQVAAHVVPSFPHGVWLVELAPLAEPDLLLREIGDALGVPEEASRSLDEVLAEFVRERELLLVLDNCEHVIDAAAKAADLLLRSGPGVRIVATSREGLAIDGEHLWLVPSLAVPAPDVSAEELATHDAVALFTERARLVRRDFELTGENAAAVAEICRRLDGIPLGIELATARLKVFSPAQIAERLNDRFRLLTGGSRTALPRQRTLAATMDWSYGLLGELEQVLLRRLSVFMGGFDFEAAERVCSGGLLPEFEVMDLLSRLVDTSLVTVVDGAEPPRYRLLETVRQYAMDKLVGAGESDEARLRHAEHFTEFASRIEEALLGPEMPAWSERVAGDEDNFRAAMTWALEAGHGHLALTIAQGMSRYWFDSGSFIEGLQWLRRALEATPEEATFARANALGWASNLALHMGRLDEAERHNAEATRIAQHVDHPRVLGRVLNDRGNILVGYGELDESRQLFQRAADALDPADPYRTVPLVNLAVNAMLRGDGQETVRRSEDLLERVRDQPEIENWVNIARGFGYRYVGQLDRAAAVLEETRARTRETGQRMLECWSFVGLAHVALQRDDPAAACAHGEAALAIGRDIGTLSTMHWPTTVLCDASVARGDRERAAEVLPEMVEAIRGVGTLLWRVGALEVAARYHLAFGDPALAARLLGAADHHLGRTQLRRCEPDEAVFEETVAAARTGLGDAFERAWEEGRAATVEQALGWLV